MVETPNLLQKIREGQVCLGTCVSFTDPAVTEALASALDFVWIDMEHSALSLETVQGHLIAARGSGATAVVRVPWNDPVLIKPVLDAGAAGMILPMVRNADEARRAVAGCLYPPEGIRGFGPRRPSNYGRMMGQEFCRAANEAMIVLVQVEHIEAVQNIDEILAVPGLSGVVLGPYDLSGSMGRLADVQHPDVVRAMDTVIQKVRNTGRVLGIGTGCDPQQVSQLIDKGVNFLALGGDYMLLTQAIDQLTSKLREHTGAAATARA